MQKDEIIQLHTLLVQIKNHLENTGVAAPDNFLEYENLGISPVHVHRSKGDHKRAAFLLGKELASFASYGELSTPALVSQRMDAYADKALRESIKAQESKNGRAYEVKLGFSPISPEDKKESYKRHTHAAIVDETQDKPRQKVRTGDVLKDRIIDTTYDNPDATFDDIFDVVFIKEGRVKNVNDDIKSARDIIRELAKEAAIYEPKDMRSGIERLDVLLHENANINLERAANVIYPTQDKMIHRYNVERLGRFVNVMFPEKGSYVANGISGYISPEKPLHTQIETAPLAAEAILHETQVDEYVPQITEGPQRKLKILAEMRDLFALEFLKKYGINGEVEEFVKEICRKQGIPKNTTFSPIINGAVIVDLAREKFNIESFCRRDLADEAKIPMRSFKVRVHEIKKKIGV